MNLFTKIAHNVHLHRKKAGLSQKGLADLAGVGKTVIYDIEKSKDTVRFNTLEKVLVTLNIKIIIDGPFSNEIKDDENE